jgi:hypothetical protein
MMQNASRHPSKSHNMPLSGDNGFCSFANGALLAGNFLALTQISLIATSPKCNLLVILQNLTHKYLFLAHSKLRLILSKLPKSGTNLITT